MQHETTHDTARAFDTLVELQRRTFGAAPTHMVRAPGRVNLIGEHTDYNGLPVFPMAIQRAVVLAVRARHDRRVRFVNLDARHAPFEFEIADHIEPFPRGEWGNYVKASASILRESFGLDRGCDACVAGDIPLAAGLSSSSALVVACALAFTAVNGLDIERQELMELTARGERYVGVQSGGMDQAICLGAEAGCASVIQFDPIRLAPTRVPDDWRFVIADSRMRAEKAGRARDAYNARVAECREALRLVSAHPRARDWPATYRGLVGSVAGHELLDVAAAVLPDPLSRRFRHVVTEALRVEHARSAMAAADRARFGQLMDASHASLAVDYEVSCAELDELVAKARGAGADGARLTGAGFGGCAVALTTSGVGLERLVEALELRRRDSDADGASSRVLIAVPSRGASVTVL